VSFETVMREAAHKTAEIADRIMGDLGSGYVKQDDLSGALVGASVKDSRFSALRE
jgi:hypothetical protein